MLVKRMNTIGSGDLCNMYRPYTLSEFVGNDTNVNIIKNYLLTNTLPHTLLFSGPAGCGKTTMARIITLSLNCNSYENPTISPCLDCASCKSILSQSNMDCLEINVGSSGGKDAVNNVVKDLDMLPMMSRNKVIIFDESHKLTSAAKDLLLKIMEDTYPHVYLIFCTNQPDKLLGRSNGDPFIDRCEHIKFNPLSNESISKLLLAVINTEGVSVNYEVLDIIVEYAKGIPRKALRALSKVLYEGSWDVNVAKNLLEGLNSSADSEAIIELCRAVIKKDFKSAVKLYDKLKTQNESETLRLSLAGYFTSCLKKESNINKALKFSQALDILNTPILTTGKQAEYHFYNLLFKVTYILN